MSELDEIRQRLDAVEARVEVLTEAQAENRRAADLFAMVDRDVADLKQAFAAQRHVLQALRDTQLEQGRVLAEHGQALGAIVTTMHSMQETQRSMHDEIRSLQGDMRSVQGDLRSVQGEMTSMQGEMTSMREGQRALQGEMTSVREILGDHGRILARLDPGEPAS